MSLHLLIIYNIHNVLHCVVTLLARLRGWSTLNPLRTVRWYANNCIGKNNLLRYIRHTNLPSCKWMKWRLVYKDSRYQKGKKIAKFPWEIQTWKFILKQKRKYLSSSWNNNESLSTCNEELIYIKIGILLIESLTLILKSPLPNQAISVRINK